LARFGENAAWFRFTSDRFDHTSELPPDSNAGNRFYGRDVAEFITAGLTERGLGSFFIDEDWGWQAHAKRADETVLEISIYHNPDEVPGAENDWALMVRHSTRNESSGSFRASGKPKSTLTRSRPLTTSSTRPGSCSREHLPVSSHG